MRFLLPLILSAALIGALGFFSQQQMSERQKFEAVHRLVVTQEEVESRYRQELMAKRETLLSEFKSDAVQKFKRSELRKTYGFERKEDAQNAVTRINLYTVSQKDDVIEVREVYETHKPKVLWEKILDLMAKEALKLTGELNADEKQDKMQDMIGMFMKDSGLAALNTPAQFHRLDLMGQSSMFYWDILYRRCPENIRARTGKDDCVRALYLAEVDLFNLSRDFVLQQKGLGLGFIRKEDNEPWFFSVIPTTLERDQLVSEAMHQSLRQQAVTLKMEPKRAILAWPSFNLPGSVLLLQQTF